MAATATGRRKRSRGAREVPGLEDEIRLLREIIQRAAAMAEEDRAVMDLVRLWGAAGRAAIGLRATCGRLTPSGMAPAASGPASGSDPAGPTCSDPTRSDPTRADPDGPAA